jgi:predicted metalloenzyme YecM
MAKLLSPFNQAVLQQQANNFAQSLNQFLDNYPELKSLCNYPIDHMAIKAHGKNDYETYINSVIQFSIPPITYTPMDQRRIATATLKEPIEFSHFGSATTLEIIEPKPEKAETADARFDHIEIRNPNFEEVEQVLNKLNIPYKPYANPKHKALVIVINDQQQEIKFTNGNLAEIVRQELNEGKAIRL